VVKKYFSSKNKTLQKTKRKQKSRRRKGIYYNIFAILIILNGSKYKIKKFK